jgi:hypothetical protein
MQALLPDALRMVSEYKQEKRAIAVTVSSESEVYFGSTNI